MDAFIYFVCGVVYTTFLVAMLDNQYEERIESLEKKLENKK